jgi:hypothetical protein
MGATLSRKQAKEHWRNIKKKWRQEAQDVIEEVRSIDDKVMQRVVACIIDAVASGHGSYGLRRVEEGLSVDEVQLDSDVCDILLKAHGPEILDSAFDKIVALTNCRSAPFVRWAFGKIEVLNPSTEGKSVSAISHDRIVYSLKDDRFVGVIANDNSDDWKVVPI